MVKPLLHYYFVCQCGRFIHDCLNSIYTWCQNTGVKMKQWSVHSPCPEPFLRISLLHRSRKKGVRGRKDQY